MYNHVGFDNNYESAIYVDLLDSEPKMTSPFNPAISAFLISPNKKENFTSLDTLKQAVQPSIEKHTGKLKSTVKIYGISIVVILAILLILSIVTVYLLARKK